MIIIKKHQRKKKLLLNKQMASSAIRKTPRGEHFKLEGTIPNYVKDSAKKFSDYVWDSQCPFASLFVWIMVMISIYYLVGLPNNVVYLDKDETTIRVEKVTRTLRWWLFTSNIIMTVLGYYIIYKGCAGAGSMWAGLWFIGSMFLSRLISAMIMASVENVVACKVPQ